MRDAGENARAVAGVLLAPARAAVGHAHEHLERLDHVLARGGFVELADEADAARVAVVRGVKQTLRGWREGFWGRVRSGGDAEGGKGAFIARASADRAARVVGNPGGIVVKKEIVMRERRRTCASGIALCFASTGMTPPRAKRFGPALLARSCARSWLRREPVASAATGGRPGWARKDRDIPARGNTTFPRAVADVTDAEAMAPACLQSRDEPRRRAVRAWCRARRSSRAKNRRAFVRGARVTRVPGRRLARPRSRLSRTAADTFFALFDPREETNREGGPAITTGISAPDP